MVIIATATATASAATVVIIIIILRWRVRGVLCDGTDSRTIAVVADRLVLTHFCLFNTPLLVFPLGYRAQVFGVAIG